MPNVREEGWWGVKRFTETTKWEDPWYMELPSKFKLLWSFICDKCDCAGVWKVNLRLASVQIGEKFTLAEVEKAFQGRFVMLDSERLWVVKFVQFQCGVLSENCPAHKPIFGKLKEHGIEYPIDIFTQIESPTSILRIAVVIAPGFPEPALGIGTPFSI